LPNAGEHANPIPERHGASMNKEEIIGRILRADSDELVRIENAINGRSAPAAQDRRLLSTRQAAEALGVSRTTIWRLANEGKLATVETRLGRRRIVSQSVTDFVSGVGDIYGVST